MHCDFVEISPRDQQMEIHHKEVILVDSTVIKIYQQLILTLAVILNVLIEDGDHMVRVGLSISLRVEIHTGWAKKCAL